jgi:hypothetical protein
MDESSVIENGIRKYWSDLFSKLGISPITLPVENFAYLRCAPPQSHLKCDRVDLQLIKPSSCHRNGSSRYTIRLPARQP